MARPPPHWTDAVLPAGIDYDAIPSPAPRRISAPIPAPPRAAPSLLFRSKLKRSRKLDPPRLAAQARRISSPSSSLFRLSSRGRRPLRAFVPLPIFSAPPAHTHASPVSPSVPSPSSSPSPPLSSSLPPSLVSLSVAPRPWWQAALDLLSSHPAPPSPPSPQQLYQPPPPVDGSSTRAQLPPDAVSASSSGRPRALPLPAAPPPAPSLRRLQPPPTATGSAIQLWLPPGDPGLVSSKGRPLHLPPPAPIFLHLKGPPTSPASSTSSLPSFHTDSKSFLEASVLPPSRAPREARRVRRRRLSDACPFPSDISSANPTSRRRGKGSKHANACPGPFSYPRFRLFSPLSAP